eukprot:3652001-Alexandrium_andersonii.AAC.1
MVCAKRGKGGALGVPRAPAAANAVRRSVGALPRAAPRGDVGFGAPTDRGRAPTEAGRQVPLLQPLMGRERTLRCLCVRNDLRA